jgi:sporulation protein YlmC with PRC-barrel domain
MVMTHDIKPNMRVIGADGVHIGTVDGLEGERIKLKKDIGGRGSHQGHHHFIPVGIVADVEDGLLRLSATGANAMLFREEADGSEYQSRPASNGGTPNASGTQPRASFGGASTDVNWGKIGFAVAAVGAVGAATMAISRGRERSSTEDKSSFDRKFRLRLQTDENMRLISSSKVEDTPVIGRAGEKLGTIKSFMVDKYTGQVAYAVLSFGGDFGLGSSLFPIPWSMLRYDVDADGYRLDITREQLAAAPRFEPSNEPEFDPSYRQRVLFFHKVG